MKNVGPINGDEKLKSGKEFVTEILLSDNEDEDFDEEAQALIHADLNKTDNNLATNKNNLKTDSNKNEENNMKDRSMNSLSSNDPEKKSMKHSKDKFREDGRNILLNLSKFTLRKIILLICDEAVFS